MSTSPHPLILLCKHWSSLDQAKNITSCVVFQQRCSNFTAMSHKNFETPSQFPWLVLLSWWRQFDTAEWRLYRLTDPRAHSICQVLNGCSGMCARRNPTQDQYIRLKMLRGKPIPLQSYAVILFDYTYAQNILIYLGCTHHVPPS